MPRKILLADDSVTAQNMGRRILSEAGYEVVTVNNGPAALKKVDELQPDLVILDIYMPGHGGIEVCQRIKENAATSNIPVLLTVGKLEPFKAEEARRVHADAHLVKPFEATELLGALERLEGKIVPRPVKVSGKAAKGKAADAATTAAKEKKFGDADSGWKNRLTIPPPEAKRPEPQETAPPTTAFREFAHPETPEVPQPSAGSSDPLSADITAEEIAAIAAAAAAFGSHGDATQSDLSAIAESLAEAASISPTPVPVEETTAAAVESEPAASPLPEPTPLPEAVVPADAAPPEDVPAEALVENSTAENSTAPEAVIKNSETTEIIVAASEPYSAPHLEAAPEMATDDEVAAALASLAPLNSVEAPALGAGNGNGFSAVAGQSGATFAHAGSSWQNYANGRARWMAEEIAVPQSEASLILEEEMQKAYAALAEVRPEITNSAVEAATVSEDVSTAGTHESDNQDYGIRIEEPSAPVEEPVDSVFVSLQSEQWAPASSIQEDYAAAPEIPLAQEAAEVHEPVAEESGFIEAVATSAITNDSEQEPVAEPAPLAEPVAAAATIVPAEVSHEESAYAAAVGTEFHAISHVEPPPAAEAPAEYSAPESPAVAPAVDQAHEAELAAAWAHWRQIRESIQNPQFTSQLADAAAAGYQEVHSQESVAPQSADATTAADESSASAVADSSAIASIVDSVLAELKPKLVAEIARKLAKEKK